MKQHITPPAIKVTQTQLECVKCGARSHATCSCGVDYRPLMERVTEYDRDNPGRSERQASADLGIPKTTVHDARQSGGRDRPPDQKVTGRDGKTYPATRPPPAETPVMADHRLTTKLANDLVDAGYKTLTAQFNYDQPTLARLKEIREDLRKHINQPIEWF
jgi:hypothetical protein